MTRKRVVITGLGAVTPIGNTVEEYWDGLANSRSGIAKITAFDASDFPCQIAGEVKGFDAEDYIDRKEARRMPRSSHFALACTTQALQDAGLPMVMENPERTSIVYGTAIGGVDMIAYAIETFRQKGYQRVNPFSIPASLPNMPTFVMSRQFKALGQNRTITTACATGTQTIGEGAEMIRHGKADIVISGGTEAAMLDFGIGGFSAMRALPIHFNDNPEAASRPFDAKREGFILSEGAATLILESLEHAQARGAKIYAEVIGQSTSLDGFHMAALDPEAEGPIRAIKWALEDAGIDPTEVDYINPHGSSTPANDSRETFAIKQVFGEHAYNLSVSSTKSMVGHPLGASGALEALSCIMAIYKSIIPPTINYEYPDPECDLDYVPNVARKQEVNVTLSNSFGLGGQNACLVLKKFSENGKEAQA